MELAYAIKYVGDMDKAVAFHRDGLGLTPRFVSPSWSEFDTGATTLALHAADEEHPAGSVQLGFRTEDLDAFYASGPSREISFTSPPTRVWGHRIARFLDSEGAQTSVSGVAGRASTRSDQVRDGKPHGRT